MFRYGNTNWNSIDSGRESLWSEPVWSGVIRIVDELGPSHYSDPTSIIHEALETEFPIFAWRGATQETFHPMFRDYTSAWRHTGVLSFEGGVVAITDLGEDVALGNVSREEIFLSLLDRFSIKGEYPFRILAGGIQLAATDLSIEEVYASIVLDWRNGDTFRRRVDATITDTSHRRLRFYLKLLAEFGIVTLSEETVTVGDGSKLERLVHGTLQPTMTTRQSSAPTADPEAFNKTVDELLARESPVIKPPYRAASPAKSLSVTSEVFARDPEVKAYVVQQCDFKCELCDQGAPFVNKDQIPFLELHHVKHLAEGGSDRVHNAVALCPNCHRAIHYSHKRAALKESLYSKVSRLERE